MRGSVRGEPGDRLSYRDAFESQNLIVSSTKNLLTFLDRAITLIIQRNHGEVGCPKIVSMLSSILPIIANNNICDGGTILNKGIPSRCSIV
jgi:hypothetical protein